MTRLFSRGAIVFPSAAAPRVRGSDTSGAAADSLTDTLPQMRLDVFNFIRKAYCGATCDEVEVGLEMRHQTASARIRELFLADLIEDSGARRKTRSRRLAIVWRLK